MPTEADIPAKFDPAIIEQAIAEFTPDVEGFSPSSTYDLVYEGERYPPKAILGIALRNHTGDPTWDHDSFNGGESTKCFKVLQKTGFVIDKKPPETYPSGTFYWCVIQDSEHYKIERVGKYLWSPKKRRNGARNPFWDNMAIVTKGDIVFHYRSQPHSSIVAVSIATSNGYTATRPEQITDERWDPNGWKVDIDHYELPRPIPFSRFSQKTFELNPDRGPIVQQQNGFGPRQGYLCRINYKVAAYLFGLSGPYLHQEIHRILDEANDHYRDDQETESNMSDTTTAAWTFQFNPQYFRREAFTQLPIVSWKVSSHKDKIKEGDKVYVWQTGGVGVIATGTIQGVLENRPDDPEQLPFWANEEDGLKVEDRIRVRIDQVLETPLSKEECLKNDLLKELKHIIAHESYEPRCNPSSSIKNSKL